MKLKILVEFDGPLDENAVAWVQDVKDKCREYGELVNCSVEGVPAVIDFSS